MEVRTLARRLILNCPDTAIANQLRFIDARPEVDGVEATVECADVDVQSGFLRLQTGRGPMWEGCAHTLLSNLHAEHYNRSRAEFPEAPMIHGASLEMGGGMVILVGDKGAGKSTLTCAMGLSGATVLGDEHVVLDGDRAITRPRTLRVKTGSLQWLPQSFCEQVSQCPLTEDWNGFRIFSVAPTLFGRPWRLSWLPIRAVVMLRSNHGGTSSMRTISADEAMPLLFDNVVLPGSGTTKALGNLRMLLTRTTLLEMRVGTLERATRLLYSV